MKKIAVLFSTAALLGWMIVTFAAGRLSGQGQAAGTLTPAQVEKVHSRLFHKGAAGQIPDMISRTSGDVHIPCVVPVVQRVALPPLGELATLACDSDLVVLGKTGTRHGSHMTADKDFLYTDWDFVVEEVLKDNPKAPVHAGTAILITRPGGALQVNGRMVYAICSDLSDFVTSREYLLYLRFVPETGAYAVETGWRGFGFSGEKTLGLGASPHYPELGASGKGTLLKTARDGVAVMVKSPCLQGRP